MRLRRLHLRQMPGLDRPLELDVPDTGVVVIEGPNGSGKSTVASALAAVLWGRLEARHERAEIDALFDATTGQGPVPLRATFDRGALSWEREGSPFTPEFPSPDKSGCFTVRLADLLDAASATDAGVAREIARHLAGGYDLSLLDREYVLSPQRGARESKALTIAQADLRTAEGEARALEVREDGLAALRAEAARCREAAAQAPVLTLARDLAVVREDLVQAEAALAQLPPAVARLSGEEAARRRELRDRAAAAATALEAARTRRAQAVTRIGELQFPGAPRPESEIAEVSARADEASRAAVALGPLAAALEGALREEEGARAFLGAGVTAESLARLDAPALREVENLLKTSGEVRCLEAEIGATSAGVDGPADPAPLQESARWLRTWQAAPPRVDRRFPAGLAAALLVGLAVASAAAAWLLSPWAALAGTLLVVAVALVLLVGGSRGGNPERELCEDRVRRLGLHVPAAWTGDDVQRALDAAEKAIAAAELGAAQRARLARLRADLATNEAVLLTLRSRVSAALGLPPTCLALEANAFATGLARWQEARARLERARGQNGETERQLDAALDAIAPFLEGCGIPCARDAATMVAAVRGIARRNAELEALGRELARADDDVASSTAALDEAQRAEAALFAALDLGQGDDAALAALLERRDAFLALRRKHDALEQRRTEIEAALSARPDLLALPVAAARAELDAATRAAAELEHRVLEINGIENDLRHAAKSTALDDAIAAVDRAQRDLDDERERVQDVTAARFLLAAVKERHDRSSRPPVLTRAIDLFSAFTSHAWQLELVPGDGAAPRFRAIETATGTPRSLAELSDGTRLQALLAARLAFALEAERGTALPLVFDEVLATSDPVRAGAIARALFALADTDDRQVLVLTCNPAETAFLRAQCHAAGRPEPHVIDLPHERALAAMPTALAYELPATAAIPAPGTCTPEEYAALLGVPVPVRGRDANALHPFWCLADDLGLLHRVLDELRVDSVGALAAAIETGAAAALGPDAPARLEARVRIARATCEEWRVGRGTPIDRDVLAASGVVSGNYLAKLGELAEELGGDAAAFLAAFGLDERTRGFRQDRLARLREYLVAHEYLDERDVPAADIVRQRVLARAVPDVDDGTVVVSEVHAVVDAVLAALNGGGAREGTVTTG